MTVWNIFAWLFAGPFYIIFFILRDTWYLFRIFTMHDGCRAYHNKADSFMSDKPSIMVEVNCFNEARNIVINEYHTALKKAKDKDKDKDKDKKDPN